MATFSAIKPAAKGGSFLLESPQPGDVFTPADLTDDMRASRIVHLGQVCNEVSPEIVRNVHPNTFIGITPQGFQHGQRVGSWPPSFVLPIKEGESKWNRQQRQQVE